MIRTDRRLRLCALLLTVILLFIWGNSLLPGEISQKFSNWVQQVLFGTQPSQGEIPEGNGILRKIAHFSEFAALGMCLAWLFGMLGRGKLPAFFWGAAAACVDETIQAFVPERAPGILDVGIDSLGVLAGIGLLYFGYTCIRKITTKSILEDK